MPPAFASSTDCGVSFEPADRFGGHAALAGARSPDDARAPKVLRGSGRQRHQPIQERIPAREVARRVVNERLERVALAVLPGVEMRLVSAGLGVEIAPQIFHQHAAQFVQVSNSAALRVPDRRVTPAARGAQRVADVTLQRADARPVRVLVQAARCVRHARAVEVAEVGERAEWRATAGRGQQRHDFEIGHASSGRVEQESRLVRRALRAIGGRHPAIPISKQDDEERPAARDLVQADAEHQQRLLLFVVFRGGLDAQAQVDRLEIVVPRAQPLSEFRKDERLEQVPFGLKVRKRARHEDGAGSPHTGRLHRAPFENARRLSPRREPAATR